MTSTPSAISAWAVARPSPRLPPVISAILGIVAPFCVRNRMFSVADRGQQLELLVARRTGYRGEDQQHLRLVGVEQRLAVELEFAERRVGEAFPVEMRDPDLVGGPDLGELGARREQRLDDLAGPAVRRRRVHLAQLGGEYPGVR